jgi:hypothetical protein
MVFTEATGKSGGAAAGPMAPGGIVSIAVAIRSARGGWHCANGGPEHSWQVHL